MPHEKKFFFIGYTGCLQKRTNLKIEQLNKHAICASNSTFFMYPHVYMYVHKNYTYECISSYMLDIITLVFLRDGGIFIYYIYILVLRVAKKNKKNRISSQAKTKLTSSNSVGLRSRMGLIFHTLAWQIRQNRNQFAKWRYYSSEEHPQSVC